MGGATTSPVLLLLALIRTGPEGSHCARHTQAQVGELGALPPPHFAPLLPWKHTNICLHRLLKMFVVFGRNRTRQLVDVLLLR